MRLTDYLRPPLVLSLALLITATLFWLLARLIQAPSEAGTAITASRIEFSRMRHDTDVEPKREEYQKPLREHAPQLPVAPRLAPAANAGVSNAPVKIVQPRIDSTGVKMNLAAGGSDRGVAPLVRVPPEYPRRAQERGIEGWVHVRFTISAAGTVKDIEVVDAEPKGMFDEAATKAVLRWRYNPRIENGVAVERVGEQTLIRFKLEN